MSITTESTESTQTYIEERIDDTTNAVDTHNQTLVIVLTVTLSTLAVIAIIITAIIIHRRRYSSTFHLKKLRNSSRLQQIVVNLSPTLIRLQHSEKKLYLSYPQYQQPHTKTIVYNYMNAPAIPIVYNSLKLPIKGETNAAFDGCLLKNEQQPILRFISMIEQPVTTLQTEFPVSLQAPVPSITSLFVEAIANHHRNLRTNTSTTASEISTSTTNSDSSRDSGTSYSNSSQTVLLFSQRTEF